MIRITARDEIVAPVIVCTSLGSPGDRALHALERRDAPGELRAERRVRLDLVAESRRLLLIEHLVCR